MRFCFVTGNRGKLEEASGALSHLGVVLGEDLSPPEIQADTLEEVAKFSLEYLVDTGKVSCSGESVVAPGGEYDLLFLEDAGLFIDALGGFPGVFSAHAYGTLGCRGILRLMEGCSTRGARFEAVVAALCPDGSILTFSGLCPGAISDMARGGQGFGFDPVFVPEGSDRSFAEMSAVEKNPISHRGRALAELVEWLQKRF